MDVAIRRSVPEANSRIGLCHTRAAARKLGLPSTAATPRKNMSAVAKTAAGVNANADLACASGPTSCAAKNAAVRGFAAAVKNPAPNADALVPLVSEASPQNGGFRRATEMATVASSGR